MSESIKANSESLIPTEDTSLSSRLDPIELFSKSESFTSVFYFLFIGKVEAFASVFFFFFIKFD